ncbi:MAG: SusC/RagA family TonB-linked outer membrane protein [Bacteroidetes bacterium]|nr:MAG: SusC/RagA family TonB-linked outer membrane protein [Bacteroidota bacterium]
MQRTFLLICLMLGLLSTQVFAQDLRITGTVTNQADGGAMPGVTVVIKGTTQGTTTDIDGNYSLSAPAGSTLVFSFIGMLTEEILIERSMTLDVPMVPDLLMLDEFVVTALGIKRDMKSLGYAIQEIQGEQLLESREANIANALTGKVSGLQVIRSSAGPASSSKIVLRGHSSLTGDNQPLIIVDGMPLQNFTGAENNDYWNPSLDMGSGIADINPDDIESISVLKGASAAALYGSRAGNGVILITTKSGASRPGLGITFSSSLGIETMFSNPEMQNTFGQGVDATFNPTSNSSWGPRIEGQNVTNWDGSQAPLRAYDNVGNFFNEVGINQNYSLSFQQQVNNTSVYTSYTRRDDKGLIPGAELTRNNLLTRAVTSFGADDSWTIDAKVQYLNSNATNRPLLGNNPFNPFFTMYRLPVSMDIRQFEESTNETGGMRWYEGSSQLNPYWSTSYNLNDDSRDRVLLQGSVKNEITDWLTAEVSAGSDIYSTTTEKKLHAGSPVSPTGNFQMGKENFFEHNFSGLLSASRDNIIDRLGIAGNLGGSIMMQEYSALRSNSGDLEVPNLFALNNGINNPTIEEFFHQKRILSMYGSLQFNWDDYFFVEGTLRNDWSSTLSLDNRSFLYPSVSTSLVFSEMLSTFNAPLPSWFTFGRLRASVAQVGNSLDPYELYNTFSIGNDPLGNTTANTRNILFNPNVRNELISAAEFGADIRFFSNRLGFDITWYKSNATRQLINLPMDPLSGYEFRKINAGDIQNVGLEFVTNARIFDNPNGFSWSTQFNYSTNKNTVESLAEDVLLYELGGFDNLFVFAEQGAMYGEIYGTGYLRVEDEGSAHFGQIIVDANGYPRMDPERKKLGNQQPKALMGITNTFAYKGLSMSFLVDGRFGGEIFSVTNQVMQVMGTAKATTPGGNRDDLIVEGVFYDAENDTYIVNNTVITQQEYWNTVAGLGNLGITEANIYDATNIRLRYINLSYSLPRSLLVNTPVQAVRLGATVNNVWLIQSHLNGVDPESVFATGTNALGFENAAPPTTRSFLFNLSVSF